MKTYKHLLGHPDIVICLDAGGTTHETLTITSSLRGCVNFDLCAKVASNNMHSGMASGIVPNPFNILINLLERVQDFKSHTVVPEFDVEIPEYRLKECEEVVKMIPPIKDSHPLLSSTKSLAHSHESESLQLLI